MAPPGIFGASALPDPGEGPLLPGPIDNGTLPNGTLPNGTLPNGTLPNGTLPNGTLPNGTLPNGTLPNGTLPNGTLPNGTLPGRLPRFENVTDAAGLGSLTNSRIAWGDYNDDGYDDIMFSGGLLYKNNRDGTFSDASLTAGTRGGYSGGVWGDYNNDGRLDFYATAWQPTWDTLYRNNGDGTFTNVTVTAGMVTDDLPSEAAAWADYDRDGCLDLYVANYEWPPLDDEGDESFGTPNILWRNNCNGTFSNATLAAGMFENRRSRGVVWGDFNNDGWQDLYVSNYRLDPNELWVNKGNGTFTDVAQARGVDCDNSTSFGNPTGACGHSIGSDFADFNNDGALDLYVANLAHPQFLALGHDTSQLYRNRGAPEYNFVNMREVSGVHYCETASNPAWGDFDGDGLQDLFITSIYEGRTNNLFRNDGGNHFTDVTAVTGVNFENGWGAGWSDFDRDGDLDLLVGSSSGVRLYRNGGHDNSYLELHLRGTSSNAAAIGAEVEINAGRNFQVQEIQAGEGTGSQSSLRLFFGLGSYRGEVEVTVSWPGGPTGALRRALNFSAPGVYELVEPVGTVDLAVTALAASPSSPVVNERILLTATVENFGGAAPEAGSLTFYRNSITAGNQVGAAQDVARLVSAKNFTVEMTAPASPGSISVFAVLSNIAPQDTNPTNDQRSMAFTVRTSNLPPVANLSAGPNEIEEGGSVTFDASRSSDDTGITQYIFDFGDGDSVLENTSVVSHVYTAAGTFTARLTVIDDNGEPSTNPADVEIVVLPPGAEKPLAVIDSITPPTPEMRGARVTFAGHGEARGGSIAEYEWTSDIDGPLSVDSTFFTTALSLGRHTIQFRVRDSNGLWSNSVQQFYVIAASGDVTITFREIVDNMVLTGRWTVKGTAISLSNTPIDKVQWRVDSSNLQLADGKGDWSFTVDTASFTDGAHDITVVVTDAQGLVSSKTAHVAFSQKQSVPTGNRDLAIGLTAVSALLLIGAVLFLAATRRRAHGPPPASGVPPLVRSPARVAPRPPPAPPTPKRRVRAVSLESKSAADSSPPSP